MRIETFKDVTLLPLRDALTGPAGFPYIGSIDRDLLSHLRFGQNEVRDMIDPVSVDKVDSTDKSYPKALFGGYLFSAYGHFLAESVHRLWPLFEGGGYDDMPILFQSFPKYKRRQFELLPFQKDILRYLNIDPDRIALVSEATHIGELHVPQQTKWLKDPEVDDDYMKLFSKFAPKTNMDRTGGNLYISRAGYMFSGSLLGETLVEQLLSEAGLEVVRPEDRNFADLVKLYASKSKIAMVEGSALHISELTGGIEAELLVLARRQKKAFKKQFAHALSRFFGGSKILARENTLPPLKPSVLARSPILYDVASFLAQLQDFFGVQIRIPDETEIQRAMLLDLARCVFDERASNSISDEAVGAQFVKLRNAVLELKPFPKLLG